MRGGYRTLHAGAQGLQAVPFLDVSYSSAGLQIPEAVTGACWDMMAILELTLTVC